MQLGQQQLQMLNLALPRLQLFVFVEELLVLREDQHSQRIAGRALRSGSATADMRGVFA